ncbi:MAG: HAD-IIB family hydrolase [Cyanobacteria bacterium J083]|nr:MAG: HAD-IIB family hydrolase [Cyanobacteria bacterium J083]
MGLIIFTDLDGTLLNQHDYDYTPALPALEELKSFKIPVIPVTSKTRAEVEFLCDEIDLHEPFVVENGSGIFIDSKDTRFNLSDTQARGSYRVKILGCTYQTARQALKDISASLGQPLRGFGDLSIDELHQLTGLATDDIIRATTREFSEPFVTPPNLSKQAIEETVKQHNFQVVVGDRFSHLIGKDAGKGKAVNWLISNYLVADPNDRIITVGLGNSPNDLKMLENVDIPIVIPGKKGVNPGLAPKNWQVAPDIGAAGWAKAIMDILERFVR